MASDLLFLAVRYVAGELSDDELAAFESRLDHDQSAREAVAQAVELAGAFAQLPATTADILPIPRRSLPMRIAALAAAACLVIAAGVVIRSWQAAPAMPQAPVANAAEPPSSVALAWSGLRQSGELDVATHSELLAWLDEPGGSAADDVVMTEVAEPQDEGLPLWLLEATSLREPTPSEGRAREN